MTLFEVSAGSSRVEFDYDIVGSGPPVVLLHARPFVRWYEPLIAALPGWSILSYRRVVRDAVVFGIGDDAEAVAALLRHVGVERPHVVGHSYGGLVTLAMAKQARAAVRSLALLEPASIGFLAPAEAEAAAAPLLGVYTASGARAAMEAFINMVGGDGACATLQRVVPDAVDDAVACARQFFEVELPAVARWTCGSADVAGITQPVLNVLGGASAPRFTTGAELIQRWLPHAHRQTIPGANHLLIADYPHEVAQVLNRFWRENAAEVAVGSVG
jgi:pimeloyl-ACP methyl ester carboxylesterase